MVIDFRKILILWIPILGGLKMGNAQTNDSSLVFSHTLNITAEEVWVDHLGQIYALLNGNELVKYDMQGNELFKFNNNTQGELTTLDVTNPLTILLYFGDFQTILLLDRTLNEQFRYDLLSLNIPFVSAVGLSNDNQIWLFDETNFRLKKINNQGRLLAESADLNLVLGQYIQPKQIQAIGNWVFLNDPKLGIFIFDQFGQYHKTIQDSGLIDIQVFDNFLVGVLPEQMFYYNLLNDQKENITIPETNPKAKKMLLTKGFLLIHNELGIEIYRIIN